MMITFQKSLMMSSIKAAEDIKKWEKRFKEISLELERDRQKLKKLNGYHEIFEQINNLLSVMQLYKKAHEYYLKFLE